MDKSAPELMFQAALEISENSNCKVTPSRQDLRKYHDIFHHDLFNLLDDLAMISFAQRLCTRTRVEQGAS
jgi:hypothetical protein